VPSSSSSGTGRNFKPEIDFPLRDSDSIVGEDSSI
jgi:hypothetical protein